MPWTTGGVRTEEREVPGRYIRRRLAGDAMRPFIALVCLLLAMPARAALDAASAEDAEALAQQRAALLLEVNGLARAGRMLYRLEMAAAPLCEGSAALNPGFLTAAAGRFSSELARAAQGLGYHRQARVLFVADGSPAARAGLAAGDAVVAVNGLAVTEGEAAHDDLDARLANLPAGQPVALAVLRKDGSQAELEFLPERTCHYTPRLLRSHIVNAAAVDSEMLVTSALLDMLESDAELATVLAHELAHGLMSHLAKRNGNLLLGKMLDAVLGLAAGPGGSLLVQIARPGERIGRAAYARDFEYQADYVAMHLLALAGYPLHDTPAFWRRLSVEFPVIDEQSYFATHPVDPERILIQAMTVEEVEGRIAAQAPLLPELARRVAAMRGGGE